MKSIARKSLAGLMLLASPTQTTEKENTNETNP